MFFLGVPGVPWELPEFRKWSPVRSSGIRFRRTESESKESLIKSGIEIILEKESNLGQNDEALNFDSPGTASASDDVCGMC